MVAKRGFTLIEILTVIGVVAVVTAISLAMLSVARGHATRVATAAKVQQCGAAILAASEQNGQRFPVVQPLPGSQMVEMRTSDATHTFQYFTQVTMWNVAVEVIGGGKVEGATRLDKPVQAVWLRAPSDFYFGQSFMAGPEYWRAGAKQSRSMWRAVGVGEVLVPSKKALIHDPLEGPSGASVCFVDGHVANHVLRMASAGVPNSLDGQINRPLLTTVDGVRGRDYP